jgi:hypothetical protein
MMQWDSTVGDSECARVCMMQWDSAVGDSVCLSEGVYDAVGQCSR